LPKLVTKRAINLKSTLIEGTLMDYKTFLNRAKAYHENTDKEDTELYFEVFKRRNSWNVTAWDMDYVQWLFKTYLFQWGGMARAFPVLARDEVYGSVFKETPPMLREYAALQNLELLSSRFVDLSHMIPLAYKRLCELRFSYKNKSRRIGPTAASKLLHFLFPKVFVIWDNRFVRIPQNYNETPDEYFRYTNDKLGVLREVVESFVKDDAGSELGATYAIEALHADDLSKMGFERFREPITKLLDEINYSIE